MRTRSYNQQVHDHPTTFTGSRTRTRTTRSNFFLPTFCRLSLNDVAKPTKLLHLSSSSSPDPSSPKISCIGQIKKRSSNTTTSNYQHLTTKSASSNNLNYTKLRKLFSAKNLVSAFIDTATITTKVPQQQTNNSKCIWNRNISCNRSSSSRAVITRPTINRNEKHVISVEDLDPPLPVVKLRPRDHEMNVNLGTRRGIELKTLQIQPFQLSTIIHSSKIIDKRPPAASAEL